MQFEYTDEQTEIERQFGGFRHVNAFGPIATGDANRFLNLIQTTGIPPRTTVYINSIGGDVEEGMKLGCLIRALDLDTSIGIYALRPKVNDDLIIPRTLHLGKCISAATLMYAGGRLRHFPVGASFCVHRFAYKNPMSKHVAQYQELSANIARFLNKMGVGLGFLSLAAGVDSSSLLELSEEPLREHQMVTGGATGVSWGTEMRNNLLYVRGTRHSIFGMHKVMLAYSISEGFYFLAVIEAQGRQLELCSHKAVEIVLNGEDKKIDISRRCKRVPNHVDVIIMAQITNEEARQVAYSDSFGVQVRTSKEAELFLGISAMETAGGQDALRTLYDAGRILDLSPLQRNN